MKLFRKLEPKPACYLPRLAYNLRRADKANSTDNNSGVPPLPSSAN